MARGQRPPIRRARERSLHDVCGRFLPSQCFLREGVKGAQMTVVCGAMKRARTRDIQRMLFHVSEREARATRQARVVRPTRVIVVFIDGRRAICPFGERTWSLHPGVKATIGRCPYVTYLCGDEHTRPIVFQINEDASQAHATGLENSHQYSASGCSCFRFFRAGFASKYVSVPGFSQARTHATSRDTVVSLPFTPPRFADAGTYLSYATTKPGTFPFRPR